MRLTGRVLGRGILIIVHFLYGVSLRTTHGRPAGDPRKTPEGIEGGEILIIVLFWVGIGECVERE